MIDIKKLKEGDYIVCEIVRTTSRNTIECCKYAGYNEHYNDFAGYFYCHEGITSDNLNHQIILKNARYATLAEIVKFTLM